jgi:hypothetical protein
MPSVPYQFLSRINPMYNGNSRTSREDLVLKQLAHLLNLLSVLSLPKRGSQIKNTPVFVIGTYLGHGTSRGRRPERRGRLPKRLRDRDGVATV